MADRTLELTIQVFNNGGHRVARVTAEEFGYIAYRSARSPYEALEWELRSMLHDASTTNPGRGRSAKHHLNRCRQLHSLGFGNHPKRQADARDSTVVLGHKQAPPCFARCRERAQASR